MAAFFDSAGNAHVENLAHAGRVIAVILEMLRPGRSVAYLRPRIFVSHGVDGMWIVAAHEGSPGGAAIGPLTISLGEKRSGFREPVDIGRMANSISIA